MHNIQSTEQRGGNAYRWYVVAMMAVVYMTNIGDRYILATVVEPLKAELYLTDTSVGLLTGFSFAMIYAVFGMVIALLADRGNRRNIIVFAILVYSVMTAACGIAQNYSQLILARLGVAVGESGTSPPSHSLISDLFPVHKRALPLALLSLGATLGTWYGFAAGSYFAQHYGWRSPFLIMTAPGLVLALLIRLTVREPPRGGHDCGVNVEAAGAPPFMQTMRFMWSSRTLRHIFMGASLINFYGYAMALWNATFMERSLGMSIASAGDSLGLWYALIGGNCGVLLGGFMTQKLGERNLRWHARTPTLILLVTFIPIISVYLLPLGWAFNLCNVALGIAMHGYMGGTFSMVQNLVAPRMRALASAALLFAISVIGLGLGPLSVGALSDFLLQHTSAGVNALREALLASTLVLPWAALHFALAERSLSSGYQAALNYDRPPENQPGVLQPRQATFR